MIHKAQTQKLCIQCKLFLPLDLPQFHQLMGPLDSTTTYTRSCTLSPFIHTKVDTRKTLFGILLFPHLTTYTEKQPQRNVRRKRRISQSKCFTGEAATLTWVRIPGVAGMCRRSSARNMTKVNCYFPLHTLHTKKSFSPTTKCIFLIVMAELWSHHPAWHLPPPLQKETETLNWDSRCLRGHITMRGRFKSEGPLS